ncbi:MAG: 50S ribosomal protein L10 [Planctomycetes bacterium]|nr:50S ribosomal protein L10 [Planctomycetota bacterium]
MSRVLKARMASEYEEFFRGRPAILFVEYRGVTSAQSVGLRRALRKEGMRLRVIKNSLAGKALESLSVTVSDELLAGQIAAAVGGTDAAALSKAVTRLAREVPVFKVRGGVLEGRSIGPKDVEKLSRLPSREALLGRLAGCLQAPLANLVGTLSQIPASLVRALDQIRREKEAQEGVSHSGPAASGAGDGPSPEAAQTSAQAEEK